MQLDLCYLFDFINYDDYKEIFRYVIEKPKNLRDEFRKLVETTLGCEEETIKNIKINPKDVYLVAIEGEYVIKWSKKEVVDRFYDAFERRWKLSHDYFRKEYGIPFEEERSKPKILLSDFLDEVAPFLFLKLAILLPTNNRNILIYYGDFLEDYPHRLGQVEKTYLG